MHLENVKHAWLLILTCKQRWVTSVHYLESHKTHLYSFLRHNFRSVLVTLMQVDWNGPLREHIATTYGVVDQSILNECRYFHVVDGLVPDIMHDLLEGIAQLTVKCLLRYLITEKKCVSVNTLNERILSFKYGHADIQNKPSEISKTALLASDSQVCFNFMVHDYNHSFLCCLCVCTASQTWCLARLLPLVISDLVSEDDVKWQHYLV